MVELFGYMSKNTTAFSIQPESCGGYFSTADCSPGVMGQTALKQDAVVFEDDRFIISYIGEIFSILDEKDVTKEDIFVSTPKQLSELIYKYGFSAIERCNGTFLAAIYEKSGQRLTIYNDRFGLYPLYYVHIADGAFYYSTNAKRLQAVCPLEPDYVGIGEYLSFDYCLEDRTIFKNVHYIMPAQKIVFAEGRLTKSIYWTLPVCNGRKEKSKKEYLKQLNSVYTNAVNLRKNAGNNAIGLTGGFDSRLILGIIGGENTSTYTFGNPGSGDVVGAQALASEYKTEHHYVTFEEMDLYAVAKEVVLLGSGQCPFERFYVPVAAKQKAQVPGAVELSGMGGDAISGQKSNFTGLFPIMSGKMTDRKKAYYRKNLISSITRGRQVVSDNSLYGPVMREAYRELLRDYNDAIDNAEKGITFGNYTMRLKLRTLERRVTMSSMWLVNQFLPIRFPVYDYSVMNFFNTIAQTYRYGQRLYIRLIQDYYPKAAAAPHSETGKAAKESHCVWVDFVTVSSFIRGKLNKRKTQRTNTFGFVDDIIFSNANLENFVSKQNPSEEGIFNLTKYGSIAGLVDAARSNNKEAKTTLKNIIHFSLVNDIFFEGTMKLYYIK